MTPTDELRNKLRRLLDEKIPSGGTEADTRFLDSEIDELLSEAQNINEAAANGWIEKAGMYQREMGDVEKTGTGQESYTLTSLKDRMEYALKMAKIYGDMSRRQGSFVMGIERPEVL